MPKSVLGLTPQALVRMTTDQYQITISQKITGIKVKRKGQTSAIINQVPYQDLEKSTDINILDPDRGRVLHLSHIGTKVERRKENTNEIKRNKR